MSSIEPEIPVVDTEYGKGQPQAPDNLTQAVNILATKMGHKEISYIANTNRHQLKHSILPYCLVSGKI